MMSIRKLGTIDVCHGVISLEFQWFTNSFRLWLVVLQRLKFSMVITEVGEPLTSCIYLSIECV